MAKLYEDYKKMQTVSKEKNSIEKTVEAYKEFNREVQKFLKKNT